MPQDVALQVRPPAPRRPDRYSRRRAAVLAAVYVLMVVHVLHWKLAGRTLAPLELNEVMYTLELGIVTAGFLFMAAAVMATAVFGRFFCSWGCHILALEDLCAWLLARLKIRPRPVRSRTLLWVPAGAMLYMFVWPQAARLLAGRSIPQLRVQTDANGWASFVTNDYWRNLPGPGVTLFTFAVCGFAIVYFLGSRAFCAYACPYGAVFSLADRLAPGRIVAQGDCAQCGICTATCQSRVRVHEEVAAFGRVVNPACLKDLDCVAICPNGVLSYGFARPALFERSKAARLPPRPFDFTLAEDTLIAAAFLASLVIFRGLYQSVPFLLTLAIGGILGYVCVLATRLLHRRHVKLNNFQLKIDARLTRAGRVFVAASIGLCGLTVHSAAIRYHQYFGDRLFAMSRDSAIRTDTPADSTAAAALQHLEFCDRWGLIRTADLPHRLATLHFSIGQRRADSHDFAGAIDHLQKAALLEPGAAAIRYNLGVLLAHTGRAQEAMTQYRRAVAIAPTDPEIHNNLGLLLAEQGEVAAAGEHFRRAIALKPEFPHPHFNLGRILQAQESVAEASHHFNIAAYLDPAYRELLTAIEPDSKRSGIQMPSRASSGVTP